MSQLKAIDGGKASANPSGIWPTEFKVLVKPKKLEDRTKGGIIIPEQTKERDQFAQMEGTLVAVSPLAFSYADDEAVAFDPPKIGDHVLFAKYAGADVTGKDGESYRLINDKDVGAVIA